MRLKLKIIVSDAAFFFLKWEMPYFKQEFELVDKPGKDVILLTYAPSSLGESLDIPALRRVALLVPGFNFNPYHDLEQRDSALNLLESHYDLALVNPGPIEYALRPSRKLFIHPFSVDVDRLLSFRRNRKAVNSLIHVSADAPQKDWERSEEVMKLTGLRHEVYPTRIKQAQRVTHMDRLRWRYNKYIVKALSPTTAFRRNLGYANHKATIKKYVEYDGFVHIAMEKPHPIFVDGKYTAALLEAGVTGSVIFWHDTYGTGNDFETVFSLSGEPQAAAEQIREIRKNINIEAQSRLTSEEISERCHPATVIKLRKTAIEEIL